MEFNSFDHYDTMFCSENLHPGLNGVIVIITTLWRHHSHWQTLANILASEDSTFKKPIRKTSTVLELERDSRGNDEGQNESHAG